MRVTEGHSAEAGHGEARWRGSRIKVPRTECFFRAKEGWSGEGEVLEQASRMGAELFGKVFYGV